MKTPGTFTFSFVTLPWLGCCAFLCAARATAQGSDACSTAALISGQGPHAFDTTAATADVEGQVNGCGLLGMAVEADVWFLWTAPQSGTVLFSTCGQTSVDTKIAVYTNLVCSTSMFPVACSDDDCNLQSQTTFLASVGTQYMLQVGSAPFSTGGTGTFLLSSTTPASNDDCALPAVINGTGSFVYDNNGTSTGAQGPGAGCPNITADVWFRWTAPATGTATLSTCGQTATDSAIAVYAGGLCPTVHSIACDDDACGIQSATSWQATAGSVYMLQVGSAGGFGTGLGSISLEVVSIPAHDDCSTPLVLGGGSSSAFDTSNATTGSEGQANSCGPIEHDLWFEWTAPASGIATVETCGTTASDTSIAVYPAGGCPTATTLVCDNDGCGSQSTVTFPVGSGSSWLIQIGDAPSASGGPGAVTLTLGAPPITPYCFGDGTGSVCPCANFGLAGRGCANSVQADGAQLDATGTASVGADTVVLHGSGMPNAAALYLQGTAMDNFGAGTPLFDGIRCVGGTLVRLATRINSIGASEYPGVGNPSVSVRGSVPAAGGTFLYQVWYRNAASSFCPPATANWTNGVEVLWVP